MSILDRIKQENDEFEDEKQVLDSADLRDLFESNTEKLFRCNVCLKSYSKITSYEAHLRIHTGESEMVCHICEARFGSLQELKSHVSTHSRNNSVFPCKLCGHVFPTLAARKRHKLVHLHANEWTCEICSRKFRQHSYYIDHMLMHKLKKDLNEKFTCIHCGTVFDDEKFFFDHQKTHLKREKNEKEDEVSNVILVAVDKEEEEQQNGTDIGMETAIPSELSVLNDEYTIIELQASDGNEFICGECGKECSDLESVSAHMETHNKEEQYECGECRLVFPYKYALLQHTRTHHTDHRPYTCDVCAASFATKSGLRNHRTIHLSLRYPCDECGHIFKGRSGLYLHKQRVHRGRKDFACDYCGKLFALKCQRDNHRRVHTGEKPYKCEICGAGFKAQSGLYVHRKTHTDERPYKCDVCGKHLRLPYNLRLHMRTHTGEKPYVCDICGRAFSQPGDCKKHKKIHMKNVEDKNSLDSIDPGGIVQEKSEFPGIGYM